MDEDYFDDIPDADLISVVSRVEKTIPSARPSQKSAPAPEPRNAPQTAPKATTTSATTKTGVVQPKPQVLPSLGSAVQVHPRQKGNKLLERLKVTHEYGPSTQSADFVISSSICALFLQMKYHRLHPEYIFGRVKDVGDAYKLKILLIYLDIDAPEAHLADLSRLCFSTQWTMVVANSYAACARYIEDYKKLENVLPKSIMGKDKKGYSEQAKEFVASVRSINKENSTALLATMGSIAAAVEADEEKLIAIPGWGEMRARKWVQAVNEPFRPGQVVARRFVPGVDEEAEAALAEVEQANQQKKRAREDSNAGAETSGIMEALARMRDANA